MRKQNRLIWSPWWLGIFLIMLLGASLLLPPSSIQAKPPKPTHPPTETPLPTATPAPPTPTQLPTSLPTSTPTSPPQIPTPTATPTSLPGPLAIPAGRASITVDGHCNYFEYFDAAQVSFVDGNNTTGLVYLKHDNQYLYVCMAGAAGTYSQRFASVYLDPHNLRAAAPGTDDISLIVGITTGAMSSLQGNGSYFVGSSLAGWSAAAWTGYASSSSTTPGDWAEFKIPLSYASPCGSGTFSLAVYHHWFDGVSNDYGWPASQYWNVPNTWGEAGLNGPVITACTYLPAVSK